MNKLQALYDAKDAPKDEEAMKRESASEVELVDIASHLVPLGLAPADYPLEEHARIAADVVRRYQSEG